MVTRILCKSCDEEFLVEEGTGEIIAKAIMEHFVNVHPSKGLELQVDVGNATMQILKKYVIFQE